MLRNKCAMSIENVTIRERILLHLQRFPEFGPDEIYNIPFDLTQDGIASVVGISRAHTSLELKKLRETEKIGEWLAHIKLSGSKRKAYYLLPDGIKEAEGIKGGIVSSGITVESLLDMKRCDPNIMLESLSSDDRETFGLACTFRIPVQRKTLRDTPTGVIPTDFEGYVRISEDVRKKYLSVENEEKRKLWQSRAADWFVDFGNDEQEKLYHLTSAERYVEASKLLVKKAELFLDNPNEDLLTIVKNMKEIPKYERSMVSIRSKIALACSDYEDAVKCADILETSDPSEASSVRSEAFMINGNWDSAYECAFESYSKKQTPGLALAVAKSLFAKDENDEALKFLTNAISAFRESGDMGRSDELLVLKAGIAYKMGKTDECLSYLGKALVSCRKDRCRETIKNLSESVKSGKTNLRFV